MKKEVLLLTMVLLGTGATAALAEPHGRWEYRQSRDWCEGKARRLHDYEHRAARDGVIAREERNTIRALQDDLRDSCGGGRWAPDRGWHNR